MSQGTSKHRRTLVAGAAAVMVALVSPAAQAAEDATLSPGGPAFAWSGSGSGLPVSFAVDMAGVSNAWDCTAWHECDETLLRVDEAGDLHVQIDGRPGDVEIPDGDLDLDVDLYVFASDVSGTAGERISENAGATAGTVEEVHLEDLAAGYYLVRVVFYQGMGATYTGDASLTLPAEEL